MTAARHVFSLASLALTFALCVPFASAGEAPRKPYSPPRTADGKPDLQGIWANNSATPMERPKILEGRATLTPEEVAALRQRQREIFAGDGDAAFGDAIFEAVISDVKKYKPTSFDVPTGNYNAFWIVERDFDNRTSLINDPPDGRMPPLTPAAMQRLGEFGANLDAAEGPEVRALSERCLSFGLPDLLPGYNSYNQIVQTPRHVLVYAEKIHDARVIPIGGPPLKWSDVRTWSGDARGHWEGDTLVVETINLINTYTPALMGGSIVMPSKKMRLVERYTRTGPNTLQYEVTIDDPDTWARKWTFMTPLTRTDERIYEYACHEGNHGMIGILAGARATERAAQASKPKPQS